MPEGERSWVEEARLVTVRFVESRYPEAAEILPVEETLAREDWPETARVPPDWRYPLAVRFVPEAFVKVRVGKRP